MCRQSLVHSIAHSHQFRYRPLGGSCFFHPHYWWLSGLECLKGRQLCYSLSLLLLPRAGVDLTNNAAVAAQRFQIRESQNCLSSHWQSDKRLSSFLICFCFLYACTSTQFFSDHSPAQFTWAEWVHSGRSAEIESSGRSTKPPIDCCTRIWFIVCQSVRHQVACSLALRCPQIRDISIALATRQCWLN